MLLHTVCLISIQHWFDKRRSLASGILSAGLSIGVFIWAPLVRWLIDLYCWQGAFIILGGIFLNGLVAAAVLRSYPKVDTNSRLTTAEQSESEYEKKESKESCFTRMSAHLKHLIPLFSFCLGFLMVQTGHVCMFAYIPLRAKQLGIEKEKIPLLISIRGILGIIWSPTYGYIGDLQKINRPILTGVCGLSAGVLVVLSTQLTAFTLLLILCIGVGICACKIVHSIL